MRSVNIILVSKYPKGRESVPFLLTTSEQSAASFLHDSEITIRGVPALFAEEGCENGKAEEFGDVFVAGGSEEA